MAEEHGVDRLTLVELIETETAKLSPEGQEMWEEYNASVYFSSDEEFIPKPHEIAIIRRMSSLRQSDRAVLDRVKALWIGLYQSDFAERKGKSGEEDRIQAVMHAARLKDRAEGRRRDPYMTLDEALNRLRGEC